MKRSSVRYFVFIVLFLFVFQCSQTDKIIIKYQVTGPGTNCYLLYDEKSTEAALFDVAGPIDTLLTIINDNNLQLKYFFFTHDHFDHVMGLPAIRDMFPEAQVCMNNEDYEDMQVQLEWALNNLDEELLKEIRNDPESKKMLEFDADTFGEVDIFIDDNQIFKLGRHKIRAIHSPGHSRGSVCFYMDDILFSGDVLFYRTVGRTDVQNSSREDQIKSVRRLYELFSDETIVYPAHGQFTDIGSEKRENKRITVDGGEWDIRKGKI